MVDAGPFVRPVPTVAPPQDPAPETPTHITLTTPEELVRWLGSLAPEEACGRPQWPNDCPLARYLNARNGHAGPRPAWTATATPWRTGAAVWVVSADVCHLADARWGGAVS
jgi:hypothetical protein